MIRVLLIFLFLALGGTLWKYEQLRHDSDAKSEAIEEQDKEIENMKKEITQLRLKDQSAAQGENLEMARLNQEIQQKTGVLENLNKRISDLKKSPHQAVEMLQIDLKREKETIANYEQQLKTLEREKTQIDLNQKHYDSDLQATLKSHTALMDAQIKEQQMTLKTLNDQLNQQKKIKGSPDARDMVEQLSKQIDDQRKFIGRLQEEKQNMNSQGTVQKNDAAFKTQGQLNDLKDSEQQLKTKIENEKSTAGTLEKKLRENRLGEADLKQRIREMESESQTQSSQIAELQKELRVHQEHLTELNH